MTSETLCPISLSLMTWHVRIAQFHRNHIYSRHPEKLMRTNHFSSGPGSYNYLTISVSRGGIQARATRSHSQIDSEKSPSNSPLPRHNSSGHQHVSPVHGESPYHYPTLYPQSNQENHQSMHLVNNRRIRTDSHRCDRLRPAHRSSNPIWTAKDFFALYEHGRLARGLVHSYLFV